jgi:hypothetical protein
MITAIVVTGHRTNPFDLEGSFTVHFSTEDFSPDGAPHVATSRGFTLTVKAQRKTVPTIEYVLERESDGVRFDGRIECRPSLRQHHATTGQFSNPTQPAPTGKLESSLHWDGVKGVLSATWIVKRPASAAVRAAEPARQPRIVALSGGTANHSSGLLAQQMVSDGDDDDDIVR